MPTRSSVSRFFVWKKEIKGVRNICDRYRRHTPDRAKKSFLTPFLAFAIETAVDTPEALQQLLRDVSCPHLKVAYDPAEFLIGGMDPLAPIETYADDIGLAFARDAVRGTSAQPGRETNLGAGHLSLPAYLAQLDSAGYRGPLVVRRANTTRPLADLAACKQYLESILTTGAAQ